MWEVFLFSMFVTLFLSNHLKNSNILLFIMCLDLDNTDYFFSSITLVVCLAEERQWIPS